MSLSVDLKEVANEFVCGSEHRLRIFGKFHYCVHSVYFLVYMQNHKVVQPVLVHGGMKVCVYSP